MNASENKLTTLLELYAAIERNIQQSMHPLSCSFCRTCAGKCCREEICRESLESVFLCMLVEKQHIRYDQEKGWLGEGGCRLAYGRPLVCYQYFCDEVTGSDSLQTASLQAIINRFASLGNKAHGNAHLLCVADLDLLSPTKINNLLRKARRLLEKTATVIPPTGIQKPPR